MLRLITAAAVTTCLLTACGALEDDKKKGDSSGATTTTMNGMAFADEASLPACNAATNNMLAYVKDTKTFETCADGAWTKVDIKGETGEKGADGAAGDEVMTKSIALYQKYKRSIFRVELQCSGLIGSAANCGTSGTYLGTAFLCGDNVACTNGHVVECDPGCWSGFTSVKVAALAADADSLNQGATPTAPFQTITTTAAFRVSTDTTRTIDLAKFTVSGAPSGLTPLPLATTASSETAVGLLPTLSMSFPLGLQDLYVDLGNVNTPFIGECDTPAGPNAGKAGYGCPKNFYDFSTSNDTDHGSSGSPLFEIETGTVIGVTSAGTDNENANYTWAIDASRFSKVP